MLFKKGNINKAISATLLLLLLLIHSVKLLHSHTGIFPDKACESNSLELNDDPEKSFSQDCGLCSYQLGKDTDAFVHIIYDAAKPDHNILTEPLVHFHKESFSDGIKGRGPPQI